MTPPVATNHSGHVENCQPMPSHGSGDGLGMETHYMLVLLVLLLGYLTRNGHNIPAMPGPGGDNTIIYFPLNLYLGHSKQVFWD